MTRDTDTPSSPSEGEGFSLRRWSRRKLAAARQADATAPPAVEPAQCSVQPAVAADPPQPLPPVEGLTFHSDFRAFLQPHVAEDLKRQALRKLLQDPRFNVMDGLDVYIDDYSLPSPLEPELVAGMMQARYIFDPPPTRVNADGHVEDVPSEPETSEPAASPDGDAALAGKCSDSIDTPPAAAGTPHVLPQNRISTDHAASQAIDHTADATPHVPDATR